MAHGADSLKSIFFALGANVAIALAKFVAAVITGSGSMLAESIHSLADTGNQVLLLLGLKRARRAPTPEHPLGYGKAIYFWSFIVALMLFSMGGLFSIYEGWHKLHSPEPLKQAYIAIGVLLFAVVAEGTALWNCLREVDKVRGDQSLVTWFRETRQSELLVIMGEDMAALLGLCFALSAVVLTLVTGNPMFDAIGSITIGVLLVVVSFFIAYEIKQLLIGQGVEPRIHKQMVEFLRERPEVAQVFNLLSLQMGNDVMVAVKAQMAESDSAKELVEAINRTEVAFKERFPQVLWLFFEPDLRD